MYNNFCSLPDFDKNIHQLRSHARLLRTTDNFPTNPANVLEIPALATRVKRHLIVQVSRCSRLDRRDGKSYVELTSELMGLTKTRIDSANVSFGSAARNTKAICINYCVHVVPCTELVRASLSPVRSIAAPRRTYLPERHLHRLFTRCLVPLN